MSKKDILKFNDLEAPTSDLTVQTYDIVLIFVRKNSTYL